MINVKRWCFVAAMLTPAFGWAKTVEVNVAPTPSSEVIHRNIYGQFMEHLGRGIDEGVWVGKDSKIPNIEGYRKDVLQALKELQVPLLRWPGGCFADEYHWRDGVGPLSERKRTVNTTWGGVENNHFGTHEFMRFAELVGAEVYINGNLGTGTPQEMAAWLEYMTSDSDSTLANMRRKNGRDKPWKVHYFAIGNEAWGCGGTMTPKYYADLYRHYASFMKTPEGNRPIMIASGGHTDQTEWTQTLLEHVPKTWSMRMEAISHHYYTLPTGDWEKHGAALGFDEQMWHQTLHQSLKLEGYIKENLAIMDKLDPDNTIGFYLDEWGTWYDTEEGDTALYQQNTLRDAVVASINLDMFHHYARRIQMSNIAQMVNVLQAMILTDGEKMLLTPTYHVFKMYTPFQDAKRVDVDIKRNPDYKINGKEIPMLSASAGQDKDGNHWLAITNMHATKTQEVRLNKPWVSAEGQLLTADKLDAHNTFEKPNNLAPVRFAAQAKDGELTLQLPAKSVVVVKLTQGSNTVK